MAGVIPTRTALAAALVLLTFSARGSDEGAPTAAELANASYRGVLEEPVALEDGAWEGAAFVPASASRPRVVLARDFRRTGDLDGDGRPEAVVLLAESSGGSGTRDHLAVVARRDGELVNLGTALLGDRVQIRSARVADGRIGLEVVQAGPRDAACCPSQKATRVFELRPEGLAEVSSEVTGTLSLADLEGVEWVLTHLAGNEPAPQRPEITLEVAGDRLGGASGCNRYFTSAICGKTPGEFALAPIGSTRMACAEPAMDLERRYLAALGSVSKFGFVSGKLALGMTREGAVDTLLFAPRSPPARDR